MNIHYFCILIWATKPHHTKHAAIIFTLLNAPSLLHPMCMRNAACQGWVQTLTSPHQLAEPITFKESRKHLCCLKETQKKGREDSEKWRKSWAKQVRKVLWMRRTEQQQNTLVQRHQIARTGTQTSPFLPFWPGFWGACGTGQMLLNEIFPATLTIVDAWKHSLEAVLRSMMMPIKCSYKPCSNSQDEVISKHALTDLRHVGIWVALQEYD